MKHKSSIIELVLAASVVMAFLLAGCYSTPDNRTKIGMPASYSSDEDLADRMNVQGPPAPSSIQDSSLESLLEYQVTSPSKKTDSRPSRQFQRRGVAAFAAPEAQGATWSEGSRQSRPTYSQSEELWIISRPQRVAPINDDQYPGAGAM